jgi:hypothetical protein
MLRLYAARQFWVKLPLRLWVASQSKFRSWRDHMLKNLNDGLEKFYIRLLCIFNTLLQVLTGLISLIFLVLTSLSWSLEPKVVKSLSSVWSQYHKRWGSMATVCIYYANILIATDQCDISFKIRACLPNIVFFFPEISQSWAKLWFWTESHDNF